MVQLTRDDLKPFQLRAGGELAQMLATYPGDPFEVWYKPRGGKPLSVSMSLKSDHGQRQNPDVSSVRGNAQ